MPRADQKHADLIYNRHTEPWRLLWDYLWEDSLSRTDRIRLIARREEALRLVGLSSMVRVNGGQAHQATDFRIGL
jgi:hypothetical protein